MASKMFFLCVFSALGIVITEGYTNCGSTKGELVSFEIDPPCKGKICKVPRGRKATVKITFKSNEDVEKVYFVLTAYPGGQPLIVTPSETSACTDDSGLTCPLKSSSENVFTLTNTVLDTFPASTMSVKFELQDEAAENLVCVKTIVQLT